VLRESIAKTENQADKTALWEALALALDAANLPVERLDALGHAYVDGGTDAAQILGSIALYEGRWSDAARLFGPLLDGARLENRDPAPWALPGWGLALLESERPEPVVEPVDAEDPGDRDDLEDGGEETGAQGAEKSGR